LSFRSAASIIYITLLATLAAEMVRSRPMQHQLLWVRIIFHILSMFFCDEKKKTLFLK